MNPRVYMCWAGTLSTELHLQLKEHCKVLPPRGFSCWTSKFPLWPEQTGRRGRYPRTCLSKLLHRYHRCWWLQAAGRDCVGRIQRRCTLQSGRCHTSGTSHEWICQAGGQEQSTGKGDGGRVCPRAESFPLQRFYAMDSSLPGGPTTICLLLHRPSSLILSSTYNSVCNFGKDLGNLRLSIKPL